MNAAKLTYDANKGQYVLQILDVGGNWQDYTSIKSQSELDGAVRMAKCSRGTGNKAGGFRVVHQFMGTTVLADYRMEM